MEKDNQTPQNAQENNSNSNSTKEVEKINAIRDIIFGHDMAEYDSQFQDIRNMISDNSHRLSETKEEILLKINDLEENFRQSLKLLEEKISAKLELLDHQKTDRQKLGTLLEEIGKKIKE